MPVRAKCFQRSPTADCQLPTRGHWSPLFSFDLLHPESPPPSLINHHTKSSSDDKYPFFCIPINLNCCWVTEFRIYFKYSLNASFNINKQACKIPLISFFCKIFFIDFFIDIFLSLVELAELPKKLS